MTSEEIRQKARQWLKNERTTWERLPGMVDDVVYVMAGFAESLLSGGADSAPVGPERCLKCNDPAEPGSMVCAAHEPTVYGKDVTITPSTQYEREKAIMALQEDRERALIETVIARAVEREREECAKIAEAIANLQTAEGIVASNIAAAIRSRASQPAPHIHTASCYKCGYEDCPCHGGYLHELPMCNPEPQGGKEAETEAGRSSNNSPHTATGASSPDASGLLASQSPHCPKCESGEIKLTGRAAAFSDGVQIGVRCMKCDFKLVLQSFADFAQFFSSAASPKELAGRIAALRSDGWAVAVHNDYRLDGEQFTFWLFTKGNRCIKGEGRTDAEALSIIEEELKRP